jgi:short-subunit dehydrogenase
MNTFQRRKTALITGASSGIGSELARLFAQDNYNLVIVARNQVNLRKLAAELEAKYNIFIKIIIKDLAVPSAPQEIFEETQKEKIDVDVLVNNAGFANFGKFMETDLQTELNMINVHIVAMTHLAKLYIREMVKLGSGKILNVASTAAFQPGPLLAVYYASKSYILLFSEALSDELKNDSITVTVLCPGPTDTEFIPRGHLENSRLFKASNLMDAAEVAKAGYEGLKEGKAVIIPGLKNRARTIGVRIFPRKMVTKISRMLH